MTERIEERLLLECGGSRAGVLGVHAKVTEVVMKRQRPKTIPVVKNAVLMLAEIKAATQAFDRGEINVIEALDAIVAAVGAYQWTEQPRRDAA